MDEWLRDILPFAAPVLVGLITSGLTTSLLAARRLRREIAGLQALVAADLSPDAKRLLGEDVRAKAVRLSSLNRYPVVVGSDAVRLLVIFGVVAFAAYGAYEVAARGRGVLVEDVMFPVMMTCLAGWHWFAFYVGWSTRLDARHRFLREAGGGYVDERHTRFVVGIANGGLVFLGFLAVGGAGVPFTAAWVSNYSEAGAALVVAVAVAVLLPVMFHVASRAYNNPAAPQALRHLITPSLTPEQVDEAVAERRRQERDRDATRAPRRSRRWLRRRSPASAVAQAEAPLAGSAGDAPDTTEPSRG